MPAIPKAAQAFYSTSKKISLRKDVLFDLTIPDGVTYRIFTMQIAIKINNDLKTFRQLPGFFIIGSNLAAELLCLDLADGSVVQIPIFPMKSDIAIPTAPSIASLMQSGCAC